MKSGRCCSYTPNTFTFRNTTQRFWIQGVIYQGLVQYLINHTQNRSTQSIIQHVIGPNVPLKLYYCVKQAAVVKHNAVRCILFFPTCTCDAGGEAGFDGDKRGNPPQMFHFVFLKCPLASKSSAEPSQPRSPVSTSAFRVIQRLYLLLGDII